MDGTYEVKADALEASFDAAVQADEVAELRGELAAMRARLDAQAAAATRPPLSGVKGEASSERRAFVDGYLRKGAEVETKSFNGAGGSDGGYAVPREIDEAIDTTLKAISPTGIGSLVGGGGGSGGLLAIGTQLLGALGLPGRATGGPVSAGGAYVVGERGPELFVPTASGRIEPMAAGGGARDVRVAISINANGAGEPQALARSGRQVARAVRAALEAAEG